MKEALRNTNWEESLGDETEVESFSEKFVNTITEALKRIKVPMYAAEKKKQQKHEKQIEKLMEKSNSINKQITKQYIQHQDKDHKIRELEELNDRVQTLISNKEEREEKEVTYKIETNSRVFYQYAAKNKK